MMTLLDLLESEAEKRVFLSDSVEIDPVVAFSPVRDMPYLRASNRQPETIIREWRSTCLGQTLSTQSAFC
jgi:hypothetical protein